MRQVSAPLPGVRLTSCAGASSEEFWLQTRVCAVPELSKSQSSGADRDAFAKPVTGALVAAELSAPEGFQCRHRLPALVCLSAFLASNRRKRYGHTHRAYRGGTYANHRQIA